MNELISTGNTKTMTSQEISDLVESRHDKVKQSIERLAARGTIQLPPLGEVKNRLGQTVTEYKIGKRDSYIIVAQLSPEFTARLVDRWQELEDAALVAALPDFGNPAAAARAWADAIEAKASALALADHATATKAEIGNRREATAMNTASQAVKKASALEIELDRSKSHASVKRMQMIYHGQKFDWRKLKSAAQEMGIEPVDIFDANYGTVKAYHADVWREVYALPIEVE